MPFFQKSTTPQPQQYQQQSQLQLPQQQYQQFQPQQLQYQPPQDVVSGEQYRYALTNFRIAHEKVEQQRVQLEEQERQVALLRSRISSLEGGLEVKQQASKQGGSSVDDFSIKNAASRLEKLINRWAADVVRAPPVPLENICQAVVDDLPSGGELAPITATEMHTQNLLRHAMAEMISEGVINCLVVTNSSEANVQLTRIHEHLFARDPTVACVWRRQTFSASVENCTPEMGKNILLETIPATAEIFGPMSQGPLSIVYAAYDFSRMLHGSNASSGGTTDAFYRAFVPELGAMLNPQQVELVKRCMSSERGELDRVGATVFPGLVKVTRGSPEDGSGAGNVQTVVRRAQVICECALSGESMAYPMPMNDGSIPSPPMPTGSPMPMNASPMPANVNGSPVPGAMMYSPMPVNVNGNLAPGAMMIPNPLPGVSMTPSPMPPSSPHPPHFSPSSQGSPPVMGGPPPRANPSGNMGNFAM